MTLKFSPQEIVYWEIERLIPSARNARTHSDKQITEIASSIKTFGMMSVILVDTEFSRPKIIPKSGCDQLRDAQFVSLRARIVPCDCFFFRPSLLP